MKILTFSDTHGTLLFAEHPEMIPDKEFDYVLVAGDIFPLDIQRDDDECLRWFYECYIPDMHKLLEKVKAKNCYIVAGNHDFAFEHYPRYYWHDDKVIYLQDDMVELTCEGEEPLKLFASPWLSMSTCMRWAFDTKDEAELEAKYMRFPDCDIFLTHCPPAGLPQGTEVRPGYGNIEHKICDFGNIALKNAIDNYSLAADTIICGHIHDGLHGICIYDGTRIVNVSVKDDNYNVTYPLTEITF